MFVWLKNVLSYTYSILVVYNKVPKWICYNIPTSSSAIISRWQCYRNSGLTRLASTRGDHQASRRERSGRMTEEQDSDPDLVPGPWSLVPQVETPESSVSSASAHCVFRASSAVGRWLNIGTATGNRDSCPELAQSAIKCQSTSAWMSCATSARWCVWDCFLFSFPLEILVRFLRAFNGPSTAERHTHIVSFQFQLPKINIPLDPAAGPHRASEVLDIFLFIELIEICWPVDGCFYHVSRGSGNYLSS